MLILNASQILTCSLKKESGSLPRKGREMQEIGLLPKGYAVLIQRGKIFAVGRAAQLAKTAEGRSAEALDAKGGVVLPGFVDSHTHAAFAAPRLRDFELRTRGAAYEEIARQGGGILKSVRDLRAFSLIRLAESLIFWAGKAIQFGTTTLEVKSGYGLSLQEEEKILTAVKKAGHSTSLEFVSTFLGAHAVGPEYAFKRQAYIYDLIHIMLPRLRGLADFCDAFCDRGYFTLEESRQILKTAGRLGYRIKLHAEQLSRTGASQMAVELGAVSVDHLDCVKEQDISLLAKSGTVCTLVPGSNFFLGKRDYPPASRLIAAGAAVALATDFNPGTCPTLSMPMILSIAVTQMKMTVEEALVAATFNGACALGLAGRLGSLETGKQADLIIAEASDYREIPYYFAMNPIRVVIKKGKVVYFRER